jgi:hydrogenase nickel incorporation protein HypA/HybF
LKKPSQGFQFFRNPVPMREIQSTQILLNKLLSQLREPKRIRSVTIALGEISELDQNLIRQHWLQCSKGTPAEQAQLHFRLIQAEVQCMACFSKYHPADGKIHCPYCGSYGAKVLSGEEFFLESIQFDDD